MISKIYAYMYSYVCVCIHRSYIYIYIYMYACMYMYVYIKRGLWGPELRGPGALVQGTWPLHGFQFKESEAPRIPEKGYGMSLHMLDLNNSPTPFEWLKRPVVSILVGST